MIVSIQVALLVLLALFVGVLIPVIISVRSLVKHAETTLGHLDEQIGKVVSRTTTLLDRADHLGRELEEGMPHVVMTMARVEEFSKTLESLRKHMKTASMIGAAAAPAVVSAIQAIRSHHGDKESHHGEQDKERSGCTSEDLSEEAAREKGRRKKEAQT
jgi:uncharacterized protein YoxC